MDYKTFFKRFGGATRTKNLAGPGAPANRRAFALPGSSELPKDFIRLCPWEAEYLFTVARRARLGIIETGRFNGGSCFVMACAAPTTPIWSIDLEPQDDERLRSLFEATGVGGNVDLIVGDSQHAKYDQIGVADLLFIDADHTYNGCLADILNWYDCLAPNGHLVFHDAYLGSWGVQDAIIDFWDDHPELEVVQSPFIGANYWTYPAGSICHFVKRGAITGPAKASAATPR